jgi:hypothetical protein
LIKKFSKENEIRKKLSKYDIIKVYGNKYLILDLRRESATLLPIDIFFDDTTHDRLIPKLSLRYTNLIGYQEVDQVELLCLLNEKNSLIRKALHDLFYERE